MRPSLAPALGIAALLCTTAAPASPKPCRDRTGKIIACPKSPPKSAPIRCKDEKGRFVACKTQSDASKPG